MRYETSHRHATRNRPRQIILPVFDHDETAKMVDHICALLIESRFGGGWYFGEVDSPARQFEAADDVCLDLMPVRSSLLMTVCSGVIERASRARISARHFDAAYPDHLPHGAALSPSTLARGSPAKTPS